MRLNLTTIKRSLEVYFSLIHDKEDEQAVIEQVKGSIVFRGTNLWILMFAILIASLGLNINSTAVIIGAMLISPLMGPIIGMGLSVGISDIELLKHSLKNYGVATLISVVTATLYFFISPLSDAQSELLARTSPTLYDVLIAFCGGAAGVLALTTRSKGQVIPGVAIATALMPPLCTAGYGLATAQWSYFFGAFYLFFINTVFIAASTFLGVKLLRFHNINHPNIEAARRGHKVITAVVVLTLIPAAIMTVNIVSRNMEENNIKQFVKNEFTFNGTHILSWHADNDTLQVVAVGKEITEDEIDAAHERMDFYGLGSMELRVIQASNEESFALAASQLSNAEQTNTLLSSQVADLQRQLAAYTAFDTLSAHLGEEARVLFRGVESVGVAHMSGGTVVLVKGQVEHATQSQMEAWLAVRLREHNQLEIIFDNK